MFDIDLKTIQLRTPDAIVIETKPGNPYRGIVVLASRQAENLLDKEVIFRISPSQAILEVSPGKTPCETTQRIIGFVRQVLAVVE